MTTATSYTINDIQAEMMAAGSHWWDRDTMRHFSCRVGSKVYQGEGGVFFVTSERCGDQPRAYSVRQYQPEITQVNTIGDFNMVTNQKAAHREAARLAGPDVVATEETHKPISDTAQLITDIMRNGGYCNQFHADYLIGMATRHHNIMEHCCNGDPGYYDDDDNAIGELATVQSAIVHTACHHCNLSAVRFSGDPRGCTVKLIMPNGETNDWGKEGWCVPTR